MPLPCNINTLHCSAWSCFLATRSPNNGSMNHQRHSGSSSDHEMAIQYPSFLVMMVFPHLWEVRAHSSTYALHNITSSLNIAGRRTDLKKYQRPRQPCSRLINCTHIVAFSCYTSIPDDSNCKALLPESDARGGADGPHPGLPMSTGRKCSASGGCWPLEWPQRHLTIPD